jgi:predicted DsbA family dithiol-disulfide isomerase
MAAVPVVVFSDFTCPFSYVTEAALWTLEDEGAAAPAYAAFELHPVPAPLPPPADAGHWPPALHGLARDAGVELRTAGVPARTRKAHEAARFAAERGVGREMRAAVYAACFRDGRDVGRIDVLVELAAGLGLDESETKAVLDVDGFTAAVERDLALARRASVQATPALIAGTGPGAETLLGAHGIGALREVLVRVAAAGG